jgi:hypothetical protein
MVPHKSTPTYAKSIPSLMETRKTPRSPNPTRRQENQPFTMGKMTVRKVSNWPKLCKSRSSGIL